MASKYVWVVEEVDKEEIRDGEILFGNDVKEVILIGETMFTYIFLIKVKE